MSSTHLATALVAPLDQLRMTDVEAVGGKNASLGEMISQLSQSGVRVPGGFATTAHAFREFLRHGGLTDKINARLARLNIDDLKALAEAGAQIRQWVVDAPFPPAFEAAVREAFAKLTADGPEASFAVRSSATAEDMPDASFAGQQETFLNVQGIADVLHRMKEVFASLYNDRAISYRVHKGYTHAEVALSAGVQRMVRSDLGSAGVIFTIDTESGFEDVVFITASYGLGETVVQGAVNPDEFYVHKPGLKAGKNSLIRRSLGSKLIRMEFASPQEYAASGKLVKTVDTPPEQRNRYALADADVIELARYALVIEKHYGRPMDIEWGKDGIDGKLYILQARPETTNRGGRTCHAAIIARELGIPAVVGCGDATDKLSDGALVTVVCSEGDTGLIYDGLLETEVSEVRRGEMPYSPIKIMMNIGNPALAFDFAQIPNAGVGLARLEFIINTN
ncbi:MAG: phosphoenolpyruvate synthase, partial [Burkholderiales bacterium]|nr:phosphoenolpyruvate synthase [Burkholderiales bacterium]